MYTSGAFVGLPPLSHRIQSGIQFVNFWKFMFLNTSYHGHNLSLGGVVASKFRGCGKLLNGGSIIIIRHSYVCDDRMRFEEMCGCRENRTCNCGHDCIIVALT